MTALNKGLRFLGAPFANVSHAADQEPHQALGTTPDTHECSHISSVYHHAVRLLLASRSLRRAELLTAAGFEFEIAPAEVDETRLPNEQPRAYVARMADVKATFVADRYPGRVVLGADTLVVADERLLGKPLDDVEAAAMLRRLSGRIHEVLTGVTIRQDGRRVAGVGATCVTFVGLSDETVAWYVESGEPRGKAGAYAIQGLASRFVDRIEGSYTNVVGLPIALVDRLLRALTEGSVLDAGC